MDTESGVEVEAKCNTKSTERGKKHHGAIGNIMPASSHVLSLSPEGVSDGYIASG